MRIESWIEEQALRNAKLKTHFNTKIYLNDKVSDDQKSLGLALCSQKIGLVLSILQDQDLNCKNGTITKTYMVLSCKSLSSCISLYLKKKFLWLELK